MTAIVLPDIDRSTLAELRHRMPSLELAEIDVPSLQDVGRNADQAIDRLLGRSRPSIWPWIAAGLALAVITGATLALVSWFRRPAWPEPGPDLAEPDVVAASGSSPGVDEVEILGYVTGDEPPAIEGGRA
jgi:hypothetical protein